MMLLVHFYVPCLSPTHCQQGSISDEGQFVFFMADVIQYWWIDKATINASSAHTSLLLVEFNLSEFTKVELHSM